MPERWERELKKLSALEPNERGVRARTAEGPSGARLRGGRERLVAGIVGAAVFGAAAFFSWGALVATEPDDEEVVGGDPVSEAPALTIVANADPRQEHAPEAIARYGGVEATIPVQGGEGWGIGNGFPAAMFGPHEAAIPVGAPMRIESNADGLEVGFNHAYPEGDVLPLGLSSTGTATLPSEPGELLIQVSATWPDGRAEFSVFVHLYEPVDVLDVDCRVYKVPVWQTRVVRAQPDGIHAAFQAGPSREVRIDAPGFTSTPMPLETGSSTMELPVPPGIATISCNNAAASQVTVVDPEGLWVPSELGCAPGDQVLSVSGEIDERLIDESVIVRRLLALEGSDEILPPGYPDSIRALPLPSRVMVRRDGRVVAKLDVWLGKPARVEGEVCSSSGIRPRTMSDSSPEPNLPVADVLRIRCGNAGADVLTPVVAAQPDGVHLRIEEARPLDAVEFANAAKPDDSFGGPVRDGSGVWPIEPGSFFVECLESLAETYQGLETARFDVVDPNAYWVPGTPECARDDSMLRVHAYDGGGADYVDDEAAIRGILHSVQPSDEVRIPFYPEGGGSKDLRYVVVRDGLVVAYVFVGLTDEEDPQGAGLTEVTGEACGSSGIAQGSLG
jgi:hypothetical protein